MLYFENSVIVVAFFHNIRFYLSQYNFLFYYSYFCACHIFQRASFSLVCHLL